MDCRATCSICRWVFANEFESVLDMGRNLGGGGLSYNDGAEKRLMAETED